MMSWSRRGGLTSSKIFSVASTVTLAFEDSGRFDHDDQRVRALSSEAHAEEDATTSDDEDETST